MLGLPCSTRVINAEPQASNNRDLDTYCYIEYGRAQNILPVRLPVLRGRLVLDVCKSFRYELVESRLGGS